MVRTIEAYFKVQFSRITLFLRVEVDVGSNEIPGQSMDHQNYFECPDKYNIAYVFYRETVQKIGEHLSMSYPEIIVTFHV